MTITATNNQDATITATFTWNNELTECNHVAIGVNDDQFDNLISAKAHEGCDIEGWKVNIEM